MSEALFFTTVFLLVIGAMGLYFYSRIAYSDRKMNYLESVLIDLRLKMEMRASPMSMSMPMPVKAPEPLETSDSEEVADEDVKDEKEFYNSVIDSAATQDVSGDQDIIVQDATNVVPAATVEYDSMTRDEIAAIAEKKSLRVTKRMNKAALINLLRESEKNTSTTTETGKDGGAPVSFTMEGAGTGASISMGVSNDSLSA